MTTFNSIWTTSLNQALQLQKKNSPLSIGGLNSASGSSGTGLLGQINTAKGLQGPLDMLLSVVSKSVSDVMSKNSLTQGMNFSNSFKSAFSLSPFQQTSMVMNNSIAANSISNLSKGIFSQATSAKSMTTQEKSNLMTTLLSGVNLGFLNSKSLLDSQGLLTEMIHESLNNLQNNVQSNIGGYYDSVISDDPYEVSFQTDGITAVLDTSSTEVPITVALSTDISNVEKVDIAGGVSVEGEVSVDNSSSESLQSILDDPAVQEIIKRTRVNPVAILSGTFTQVAQQIAGEDAYYNVEVMYTIDGNGDNHSLIMLPSGFEVVDGNKVFEGGSGFDYIKSISPYKFRDSEGILHELKGNWDGEKITTIELDGKTTTADELVEWAKNAGLESETFENYGTEYYATVELEGNASYKQLIAHTISGNIQSVFGEFGYSEGASLSGGIAIESQTGYKAVFETDYVFSYINGKKIEDPEELIQWAENNGFEKETYQQNGKTVEVYLANMKIGEDSQKIVLGGRVDGKAANIVEGKPLLPSESVVTGEKHDISLYTGKFAAGGELYALDGTFIGLEDLRDWAVDNLQIRERTGPDGTVYTEYHRSECPLLGDVILAESNGTVYSRKDYIKMVGPPSSPITLDMNGDGIKTVSAEEGVEFDLLGNGQKVQTGWTAGGDDAFLALDRDDSGSIEGGKELFGDQWGAANGYEELAKFDDNNDGVIDNRDKVYSNLKLWNDANMNGVSEAGELRGLAESGVASISTGFKTSSLVDAAGNEHRQVSSFTKTNGQKGVTTDLWFRYYGITSYINNQYLPSR